MKSKKKSPRIAQIALIYSSGTASLHRCTGKSWLNSSVTLSAFGIEPALKIRMGGEYVKFKLQFGLSLTETLTKHEFNYDKTFMNVGLEFSF